MIIPIRCSCGKVLADKWEAYKRIVDEGGRQQQQQQQQQQQRRNADAMDTTTDESGKTVRGRAMDNLGITKLCCRGAMLTHVDMLKNI
jgi:DNA-directed RNA polymerase subunit N (RpoN/RPB10)